MLQPTLAQRPLALSARTAAVTAAMGLAQLGAEGGAVQRRQAETTALS